MSSSPAGAAPIASTAEALLALAERCEREGASVALDAAIGRAIGNHNGAIWWTRKLDDAVTLVPENCWWHLGCGRLTPDEPLWGAIVSEAETDKELGAGETNATAALAICAAALRARAGIKES